MLKQISFKGKLQSKGFTLLEIMIVLVIIAIMAGVAVLNVTSSNYSSFMADGLKIAATLEIIADEAVYTNSVIVCDVAEDGFVCQGYKNSDWRDIDIKKLISWPWPKNLKITSIYISGRTIKDDEKIRFFPNGNIAPMSFQITDGVHNAWVDGDMNGTFQVNN